MSVWTVLTACTLSLCIERLRTSVWCFDG